MSFVVPAVLFALGAIVASFIGVLAGRLHTGQSFISGRSRCDACNIPLTLRDLIPIYSYLAGNARARCCGARMSILSPVTELVLGILFVLAYERAGLVPALVPMLCALSALLALVMYDMQHQILPPSILGFFIVASGAAGYLISSPSYDIVFTFLIAMGIATFLAMIHFLSRGRAMGFSDAPLAFGLSLLVGPAAIPGLLFSFWIGAAIGIAMLFRRPRGSRMGVEVPFAPFLAAGFLLAYFTQWNPITFVAALS